MTQQMDPDGETAIPVTIFGRTYHLRGGVDEDRVRELASIVDGKMKEIAESTGTADTLKVAILACLNIADESMGAGRKMSASRAAALEKRLGRMVTILDEALAG